MITLGPPGLHKGCYFARSQDVTLQGETIGWISQQTNNAVPANRDKWMGRCTTSHRERYNMDSKNDAVQFVQQAHDAGPNPNHWYYRA